MGRPGLDLGQRGEISTSLQGLIDGKWRKVARKSEARETRWQAVLRYRGYDGRVERKAAVAATKREAEAKVSAAVDLALKGGNDLDLTGSTPLVAVGEMWLRQIKRTDSGLKESTVREYERTYRRSIDTDGSSLRGLSIAQANSVQRVRGFLEAVADERGSESARQAKNVLSLIFDFALQRDVIESNAARSVGKVVSQNPKEAKRDHTRALTPDERAALFTYLDDWQAQPAEAKTVRKRQTVGDLIAFLAGTGVRISEALSLRWEHLNLEDGYAHIHGTKSRSAKRRVDLPSWLSERLSKRVEAVRASYLRATANAKHTDTQSRAEVIAGIEAQAQAVGVSGYVFSAPGLINTEAKWSQSNAYRDVRAVLDKVGLGWAISHTFRRTVATRLGEQGVPLVQIADQLGHADPAMTASVYLGRDFEGDKSHLAALL